MKLLDLRITEKDHKFNMHNGHYELKGLFPRLMELSELVFENEEWLYYARDEEYVTFFANSDNHTGFGGRRFELPMANGKIEELVGPWSSGAYAVNTMVDDRIVDLTIVPLEGKFTSNKVEWWAKGNLGYSGHTTVDAIKRFLPDDLEVVKVNFYDHGITYCIDNKYEPFDFDGNVLERGV